MTDSSSLIRSVEILHSLRDLVKQQREIEAKLPVLVAEAFSHGVTAEIISTVTGLKKTRVYRLRDLGS